MEKCNIVFALACLENDMFKKSFSTVNLLINEDGQDWDIQYRMVYMLRKKYDEDVFFCVQ